MNLSTSLISAEPDLTSASSGDSVNSQDYTPYSERPETYIVPVVFVFIFITGTFGNASVIYVLITEKLIKHPSYLYILSLSLGDLVVILGTVPFVCTIYTFESWPYGQVTCQVTEFIRDFSIGVSVFTLSAMSYDRYKAAFSTSIRQHHGRPAQMKGITTVASIWILSILFAFPFAYNSFLWSFSVSVNKTILICYPFPAEFGDWYPKTVVIVKCLVFYLIPLTIIACCYISIAIHLIRKSKQSFSAHNGSSSFQKSSRKSFSRATIVLLFVLIFIICFFPHHFFMIWFYFHPKSKQLYNQFWHIWRIVSFVLSFLGSCLNPITLCVTSEHFRALWLRRTCGSFFLPKQCEIKPDGLTGSQESQPSKHLHSDELNYLEGAGITLEASNATRQITIRSEINSGHLVTVI